MLMRDPTKERNNGTSPLSKAAEKLAKKCRTKRCDGNCELLLLLFGVVVFSVLRFVVFLWSSA